MYILFVLPRNWMHFFTTFLLYKQVYENSCWCKKVYAEVLPKSLIKCDGEKILPKSIIVHENGNYSFPLTSVNRSAWNKDFAFVDFVICCWFFQQQWAPLLYPQHFTFFLHWQKTKNSLYKTSSPILHSQCALKLLLFEFL